MKCYPCPRNGPGEMWPWRLDSNQRPPAPAAGRVFPWTLQPRADRRIHRLRRGSPPRGFGRWAAEWKTNMTRRPRPHPPSRRPDSQRLPSGSCLTAVGQPRSPHLGAGPGRAGTSAGRAAPTRTGGGGFGACRSHRNQPYGRASDDVAKRMMAARRSTLHGRQSDRTLGTQNPIAWSRFSHGGPSSRQPPPAASAG